MKKHRSVVLTALCLGVVTASLFIFVKAQTRYRQEQLPAAAAERRGTIAWHVKQAKLKGKAKVKLSPVVDTPAVVRSLDEAVSQYAVVVGQLVEKRSYIATEDSLTTWNKFKVEEVLSEPASPICPSCLKHLVGPPDMLPLSRDEILFPTNGGLVTADGVQVESNDTELGEHFSGSQKYLLFISLHPSKRVGKLQLGPDGVFVINSLDQLTPIEPASTPLKQDLQSRFGSSLKLLKEFLKGAK
jgi:hypothetical protein